MTRRVPNPPPRPSSESIRDSVGALPVVGPTTIIDERAALAARFYMARSNPTLSAQLDQLLDAVVVEVGAELDFDDESECFIVTHDQLRGVIARAIARAAGQMAISTGEAYIETTALENQFRQSAA